MTFKLCMHDIADVLVACEAVRAKIRKLISSENPSKPMSDNQIAKLLSEDGVKIARRTIAKYREAMNIASSSDRKKSNLVS
jgi:RNA polymerase sigma-54 factor